MPSSPDKKMPILFIGHGSPMNAIDRNPFTAALNRLGDSIPKPKAILCISAHWMTEGTWVTHMEQPKTIHDFYGFPEALFAVRYPAPGSPEVAETVAGLLNPRAHLDDEMWGLDHGTWSVLLHLYPQADIPVLQLSLYLVRPPEYHFRLGSWLKPLREQGVLIVGSGNIVHNLKHIQWESDAPPYPWATEFDRWAKERLVARDFDALQRAFQTSEAGRLSVPTLEHYLPMLYILGAAEPQDALHFEFEGIQNSSISMRSFSFRPSSTT